MKFFIVPLAIAGLTVFFSPLPAQSIWNDNTADEEWDTAGNWSTGTVPNSSVVSVEIGTQPGGDNLMGLATAVEVGNLSFLVTLTQAMEIEVAGGIGTELSVNGPITNSSADNQSFFVPVVAVGNGLYAGGSGGLSFSQLSIGTSDITTSGTVDVSTTLVFTINSNTTYGQIGSVDVSGATVNIGASGYTAAAGDTFTFATGGDFAAASSINTPTLSGGLSWDIVQDTNGLELMVVPEPGNVGLFLLGLGLLVVAGVHPRLRRRLLPALAKK